MNLLRFLKTIRDLKKYYEMNIRIADGSKVDVIYDVDGVSRDSYNRGYVYRF